ncbi:ejaculatory bulb-specific protein 3 [Aethina tumida]|uniref:ejaculatory bulb-specific protein 3 n=1 Tax=Aethina tumida TaxID=116153 RepID=UPI00096B49FA|nr:ejaculatory bulb-specific protein 3 [Aethina tumida]
MKVFVFLLVAISAVLVYGRPDDQYTTKYDNIDLDQILQSDRLLNNYINCIMDRGKCTPDGQELKKVLPEALQTDCAKCNEKQKEGAKKVLRFLVKNKRPVFDEVAAKFDPEKIYINKYRAEFEKEGITV